MRLGSWVEAVAAAQVVATGVAVIKVVAVAEEAGAAVEVAAVADSPEAIPQKCWKWRI
jgi:type IV pilus biogenesis protein CpaD/CtpE